MTAREEILAAVTRALVDVDRVVVVDRGYRDRGPVDVERFVERVRDYRAVVVRCDPAGVDAAIGQAVPAGAVVVVPAGLPWTVPGAQVDEGFTATALDAMDVVVTAATLGIAETGTIVLTHGAGEGRRAVTLVPDTHVVVVRESQLVADVPDAVARLHPARLHPARLDPARPQTWISGPSATSDIELNRVEGVHGPRTLHVVLVADLT